jgi:MerR family copper efflux transcriptional regulator
MRISELAERVGVPATTLRFYETAGLLAPERTAAGYRVYDEEAVDRLDFIRAAKHLGLPLDEVAELLAVWQSGACVDVKVDLRPRLVARLADAEARAAELASFITTLQLAQQRLDSLPDRTGRCDPACGFLSPPAPTAPPVDEDQQMDEAAPKVQERWRNAPVACSLDGGDHAERLRQWQALVGAAPRQPIPDGLRFTFPADRAGDVAKLAAAEQECCPFLDFQLRFNGPQLVLEVRAPAEASGLLADLFTAA